QVAEARGDSASAAQAWRAVWELAHAPQAFERLSSLLAARQARGELAALFKERAAKSGAGEHWSAAARAFEDAGELASALPAWRSALAAHADDLDAARALLAISEKLGDDDARREALAALGRHE